MALSHRAAALELQLKHDDTIGSIDTAPLIEAFDVWQVAVRTAGAAEAIAA